MKKSLISILKQKSPKQGDEIRELKKSKPDKATMKPHVDELLALKGQYKEEAGRDYAPSPAAAVAPASAKLKAPAPPKKESKPKQSKDVRNVDRSEFFDIFDSDLGLYFFVCTHGAWRKFNVKNSPHLVPEWRSKLNLNPFL